MTSFALAEIRFHSHNLVPSARLPILDINMTGPISVHNQPKKHAEWSNEVVNSVSADASPRHGFGVLHNHEFPRISSNKSSRFLLSLVTLLEASPLFHQLYTLHRNSSNDTQTTSNLLSTLLFPSYIPIKTPFNLPATHPSPHRKTRHPDPRTNPRLRLLPRPPLPPLLLHPR